MRQVRAAGPGSTSIERTSCGGGLGLWGLGLWGLGRAGGDRLADAVHGGQGLIGEGLQLLHGQRERGRPVLQVLSQELGETAQGGGGIAQVVAQAADAGRAIVRQPVHGGHDEALQRLGGGNAAVGDRQKLQHPGRSQLTPHRHRQHSGLPDKGQKAIPDVSSDVVGERILPGRARNASSHRRQPCQLRAPPSTADLSGVGAADGRQPMPGRQWRIAAACSSGTACLATP